VKAIVDTSVWSLALRRQRQPLSLEADELAELIREGRAIIIGPVRQELLSGVKGTAAFQNLRQYLRAFPDCSVGRRESPFAPRKARSFAERKTTFV
jgi:hypothetical protein